MGEGIIILGHGSRRQEANEEIREIAALIKKDDPHGIYETAFLSFADPDLSEAVENMIRAGIDKIIFIAHVPGYRQSFKPGYSM
jgi:sirohydrochlorin ferrochelatase